MLTDFYIPRLSNDMKSREKNHLGVKKIILYRSLVASKKRRQNKIENCMDAFF